MHKRNVSLRRFFYAHKTYIIIESYQNRSLIGLILLNSVCPKFISNWPVSQKIGFQIFEVLLHTKSVCATNTRPGGKSPIQLYRKHILLKSKIKTLASADPGRGQGVRTPPPPWKITSCMSFYRE